MVGHRLWYLAPSAEGVARLGGVGLWSDDTAKRYAEGLISLTVEYVCQRVRLIPDAARGIVHPHPLGIGGDKQDIADDGHALHKSIVGREAQVEQCAVSAANGCQGEGGRGQSVGVAHRIGDVQSLLLVCEARGECASRRVEADAFGQRDIHLEGHQIVAGVVQLYRQVCRQSSNVQVCHLDAITVADVANDIIDICSHDAPNGVAG